MRFIRHHVTFTFVHPVVGKQSGFASGVDAQRVSDKVGHFDHLSPDTCFVHLSGEIVSAPDAPSEYHRADTTVRYGLYAGNNLLSAEVDR